MISILPNSTIHLNTSILKMEKPLLDTTQLIKVFQFTWLSSYPNMAFHVQPLGFLFGHIHYSALSKPASSAILDSFGGV